MERHCLTIFLVFLCFVCVSCSKTPQSADRLVEDAKRETRNVDNALTRFTRDFQGSVAKSRVTADKANRKIQEMETQLQGMQQQILDDQ